MDRLFFGPLEEGKDFYRLVEFSRVFRRSYPIEHVHRVGHLSRAGRTFVPDGRVLGVVAAGEEALLLEGLTVEFQGVGVVRVVREAGFFHLLKDDIAAGPLTFVECYISSA